jgi:16S rRNA (uracil1498-N3)-methyltransferase
MEPAYFLVTSADLDSPVFNISGTEAHHALRVRRVREKEILFVTDGIGQVGEVEVLNLGPGEQLTVKVINKKTKVPQKPIVSVAQALAKGERSDLAIESLTEVGVNEIIPWQANRCIVKWDTKSHKGIEKWKQITRESSKQSRRAFFPEILECVNSKELINVFKNYSKVILLDPDSRILFNDLIEKIDESVLLIIGPEGGVDDSEIELFTSAGAQSATLGETILRTSTAGGIAAAILLSKTRWIK